MEKRNIPEIRFKGFSEDWEEEQLGELVNQVRSYPLSRNVEVEENTNFKYIHYGDIHKGIAKDINNVSDISYIYIEDKNKFQLLEVGDFIVADASEDYKGIANPSYIKEKLNFNLVAGLHTIAMRPIKLKGKFLYYLFDTDIFRDFGQKRGTGTKVYGISFYNLTKFKTKFPRINEQEKIGQLFESIDKMIEAQRKLIEENKKIKKSLLPKMFPKKGEKLPELRLKGFSVDWQEKRLGKLTIKNNKKNKDLQIKNVESVSNKYGFIKQEEQFDRSVASKDLSNYFVIKPNMFAYNPSRINVGSIGYKREGDGVSVVSPLYISFITKNEIYDLYLWYWLKTKNFTYQRKIYTAGTVRETLSYDSFSEIYLKYPSLSEQEAIGKLFKPLDEKIENEEKKLENYKNLKKSLLQKMFI